MVCSDIQQVTAVVCIDTTSIVLVSEHSLGSSRHTPWHPEQQQDKGIRTKQALATEDLGGDGRVC